MIKHILFSLCGIAVVTAVVWWVMQGTFTPGPPHLPKKAAKPVSGSVQSASSSEDGITVYFSPNGGCTEALVSAIANAKQSVYVQAAQFTSAPIAKALIAAKKRGIDVRVVLDRKKDDDDRAQTLRLVQSGVPTFADARHHTAHNKVTIIDHHLVTTGSFNFTKESEAENAENLVLIDGHPDIAAAYEKNFLSHLAHSDPYEK